MKTNGIKRILAYMACTAMILLYASCSSDGDTASSDETRPAVLSLSLSSDSRSTSRVGGSGGTTMPTTDGSDNGTTATVEAHINGNRVCVGLFDSSNNLVTLHEYTYSRGSSESIATTTRATRMLVAANIPTGAFSGIYNLSGFQAVVQNLGYTSSYNGKSTDSVTVANSQKYYALPMISSTQTLTWGSSTLLSPAVTLSRVVSRIALVGLSTSFSGNYSGSTFVPKEIFVGNAATEYAWSGTSSGIQSGEMTTYTSGTWSTSASNYAYLSSGLISTWDSKTGDQAYLTSGTDNPYYFYVFPSTSTSSPTRLVIKGLFTTPGGTSSVVYYPIKINSGTLAANSKYALTVTISGIGTATADEDITSGSVTVTVSVANYTSSTFTYTFS